MLRILVIGDPHFKENNALETEEMTEKILVTLREIKPDFVVCLGDVLDRHEKISLFALRRATFFIESIALHCKIYVLVGNHDRPNNSTYLTDEHPFLAFRGRKNIVIVDNILQDKEFLFVPYVPPGMFLETLGKIKSWKESKIIFAHQELSGAKMGAIISQVEEWKKEYPLLISGHIHDYQEVRNNFIYVGTPIQHGYHDTLNKTISLLILEKEEISHQRIDLGCRKKRVYNLSIEDLETFSLPENTSVKIVISGESEKLKLLHKEPLIKKLREKGVKVHYKPLDKKEVISYEKSSSFFHTLREIIAKDSLQLLWLKKLQE